MAYTNNPNLPKVRGEAVALVAKGWSVRKVARHLGFTHSAVVKWVAKSKLRGYGPIPTGSSKPKKHPQTLTALVITAIIEERTGRRRCAEHVHQALKKKGVDVSLSSVKRTLDRCNLRKKRSPWKRPHDATERPEALYPGALVQIDTIHFILPDGSRIYVYTLIDLFSRWAYAEVVPKIGTAHSVSFVRRAQKASLFRFLMLQSDHGPEFQKMFRFQTAKLGMTHRYSRVRKSNDNAHVERFNRTVQEECLDRTTHTIEDFRKALRVYMPWYNEERTHMGINYQTPLELVPSY
jgi:transposase InsO family protein